MTRSARISQSLGIGVGVCCLLLLAVNWINPSEARAQTGSKEYQVKAAYLLNFAQYIEWPAAAFPDAATPIAIGVLGDDPFGAVLEDTFQGESPQGRKLVVKRSRRLEDLKDCHVLFISKSEKDRLTDILTSLNDTTVATVGEVEDFARRGGILNFYFDNNKVRFEINADAAQSKGLKINSQLLKRAKIVGQNSGKGGK